MILIKQGCDCVCTINVKKDIKVGDTLNNGAEIKKIKPLKNGKLRIEADLWSERMFGDDELLKLVYQTKEILNQLI